MNKTELINAVAKKANLSKVATKKAVAAFIQEVESALKEGKKVNLLGFGAFSVVDKPPRMGINPKTKAPVSIPAKKVVRFKSGALLARAVR